ncbi:hypothetical protein BT93_D0036 [Corymbia citriodora subsp. variegata]|nr:hypothetical protein BT93_D0036 [Corymbia citriodora subsp. variegata]
MDSVDRRKRRLCSTRSRHSSAFQPTPVSIETTQPLLLYEHLFCKLSSEGSNSTQIPAATPYTPYGSYWTEWKIKKRFVWSGPSQERREEGNGDRRKGNCA